MDITQKWDFDEAQIVRFMEGFEDSLEERRQKAREKARELGCEQDFEKALEKARVGDSERINRAAAQNALANGLSYKVIIKMTGFDMETLWKMKEDIEVGIRKGIKKGIAEIARKARACQIFCVNNNLS
jgi:hypothetical protein